MTLSDIIATQESLLKQIPHTSPTSPISATSYLPSQSLTSSLSSLHSLALSVSHNSTKLGLYHSSARNSSKLLVPSSCLDLLPLALAVNLPLTELHRAAAELCKGNALGRPLKVRVEINTGDVTRAVLAINRCLLDDGNVKVRKASHKSREIFYCYRVRE